MKRRMMLVACWTGMSLGLMGCAKKETAPAPQRAAAPVASEPVAPPPPPAATCGEVKASLERAMEASVAETPDMPPEMREAVEKFTAQVGDLAEQRCIADAWSDEARTCLAEIEKEDDFERCEDKLTKGQQTALEEEMKRVMMESLSEETAPAVATAPIFEETGILACNEYLRTLERFVTCEKVPQEARAAVTTSAQSMKGNWASLRDPAVPREALKAAADGCKQAVDALKMSAKANGCPL
jgi:hypothetical protein